MGAQLAHAKDDHVLRVAAATPGGYAELLAMACVQPVIRQIDRSVGEIGKVATGFGKVGLTGQVAPDDPHLLAGPEAAQGQRQGILAVARGDLLAQCVTHLDRRERSVQPAQLGQLQQHLRISTNLFADEVARRTDSAERLALLHQPGAATCRNGIRQAAGSSEERLFGTTDKRQKRGRQCNQRWQTH